MEKLINIEDSILFANLFEDFNPIHNNEEFAKEKGLIGRVAQGAYVASCFAPLEISYIDINFRRPIYHNFNVISEDIDGKRSLKYNKKELINMSFKIGMYPEIENKSSQKFNSADFSYKTIITNKKIDLFNELTKTNLDFPEMYLFSLSTPAVYKYGLEQDIKSGMHIKQSLDLRKRYNLGEIEIAIEKKAVEPNAKFDKIKLDFYWIQKDKIIATGKSEVIAFK